MASLQRLLPAAWVRVPVGVRLKLRPRLLRQLPQERFPGQRLLGLQGWAGQMRPDWQGHREGYSVSQPLALQLR